MKELIPALIFLGTGSVYDVRNRELPGCFLLVSGVLAVFCNAVFRYQPFSEIICGILLGGAFLAVGWFTKESIGYGDGIGIMIMGILLGGKVTVVILAGAFFMSAVYGVGKLLLKKGKASDTMPFYPFLFLAALGGVFL